MLASTLLLFLWSGFLALAFLGWGCGFQRMAKDMRSGFALRIVWGISLSLFAIAMFMAVTPQLFLPITLGWLAIGFFFSLRPVLATRLTWRRWWIWLPMVGLVVLQMWILLYETNLNPADDYIAYIPFAKKLLASGSMEEPFSLRRMASFGGQTVLQSWFLLAAPDYWMPLMDKGWMWFLTLALFWELLTEEGVGLGWRGFLLFCLAGYEWPRINAAAQTTGVALALGVLMTWRQIAGKSSWKSVAIAGLVLAAFCSLRANYVSSAGVFTISLLVFSWLFARQNFQAYLRAAALSAIALVPWMWLLYQSSSTPLFPLFKGGLVPEFATFNPATANPEREYLLLRSVLSETQLPAYLLVAILTFWLTRSRALWSAVVMGTVVPIVYFLFEFKNMAHGEDAYRYQHAFLFLSYVTVALEVAHRVSGLKWRPQHWRERTPLRLALVVAGGSALLFFTQSFSWLPGLWTNLQLTRQAFAEGRQDPFADRRAKYQQVQALIPAGQKVLVMVDEPFLLDFKRNPIWLMDIPGNVTPDGRPLPWTDVAATDARLVQAGVNFLLLQSPDTAQVNVYMRAFWQERAKSLHDYHGEWRSRFLDVFSYVDEKAQDPRSTRVQDFFLVPL